MNHLIEHAEIPINILDDNRRNALHSVLIKSSNRQKCLKMVKLLGKYGKGMFHTVETYSHRTDTYFDSAGQYSELFRLTVSILITKYDSYCMFENCRQLNY